MALDVADGKPIKQIAQELGIKQHAVSSRLRVTYERLGINNRIQFGAFIARLKGQT